MTAFFRCDRRCSSNGTFIFLPKRFDHSGSKDYPSHLVRLELTKNNVLLITHVRPIQFDTDFNIGNFPNDGIEGMAFGQNNTLSLGLEKDSKGSARIFSFP